MVIPERSTDSGETRSPSASSINRVEGFRLDPTLGGLRGGNRVDISAGVAMHFNERAGSAAGLLEGEYVAFEPGTYSSVGLPIAPRELNEFIAIYNGLVLVYDGSLSIPLTECPRWFSRSPDNLQFVRGAPTYVPITRFPSNFFGAFHEIELFESGRRVCGPETRFFHGPNSGLVALSVSGGKGKFSAVLSGDFASLDALGDAARYLIVDTDPAFGLPSQVVQVMDQQRLELEYRLVGLEYVGDSFIFNNAVVYGVQPNVREIVLELTFEHSATGFAAVRGPGHATADAVRPDVSVL